VVVESLSSISKALGLILSTGKPNHSKQTNKKPKNGKLTAEVKSMKETGQELVFVFI
jgi:hypothetical protein